MATSVAQLGDGESYSIAITDSDGDSATFEVTYRGIFIPPGQNLENGLEINQDDTKVILQALQEMWV